MSTSSALPESEKKKFLNVAKEGFNIDDNTNADKARKDVVNEKYGPLQKCQGEDSLTDHILRAETQDMRRDHLLHQKKTREINLRHPLIKKPPRRVETNPADTAAPNMTVMTYNTATNSEAVMRQTLGVDADEMIDEKEEVPAGASRGM